MNQVGTHRGQGVRLPEQQTTEQAPSMEVTDVIPVQMVLVRYGDERGRAVTTLALICGNKVTVLPDQGRWTATWKPLNSKLAGQVVDMLATLPAPSAVPPGPVVPSEDAVDLDLDLSGKTG